jgi:hypothetical protein
VTGGMSCPSCTCSVTRVTGVTGGMAVTPVLAETSVTDVPRRCAVPEGRWGRCRGRCSGLAGGRGIPLSADGVVTPGGYGAPVAREEPELCRAGGTPARGPTR